MRHTIDTVIDQLRVNKISVGEQLHGSLYCSCMTMSALKLCEEKKK